MPIRVRLSLLFAIATLSLVALGGVVFLRSLEHGLATSLDAGLRSRADTVRRDVAGAPRTGTALTDPLAQVLDATGRVVESSDELGHVPIAGPAERLAARHGPVLTSVNRGSERYRVLAQGVRRSDGWWTAVVASSLDSADDAVTRVKTGLALGGVAAVVLAAVGGWYIASAALRPVEAMRRKAAAMSEDDTGARLPVPPTRDELASLASTMNDLLDRLQGALFRQRAFVADAGHELRTPLAVLRTELELADRPGRSREELLDAVRNAIGETDRVARLAEELLFLARSDEEQGAHPLELEPVLPVLRRSAQSFSTRAGSLDVTIRVSGDDDIVAPIDVSQVRRAVENLVDNALRFAPRGSEVSVTARRDESDVVISVSDAGPGFPPEFLPHAFERFRRADDARSRSRGGSGLGLAIVQAVAGRHGGVATAAGADGGGALVSLRLPTQVALASATAEPEQPRHGRG